MSLEIAIDVAMEECIMKYVKRICEVAKQFLPVTMWKRYVKNSAAVWHGR